MRVVLIEFSPSGGLFQFAVQLGEALAGRGDHVRLLTGPDPELRSRHPGFAILPRLATWHPQAPGERLHPVVRKARRGVRAGQLCLAWAQVFGQLRRLQPDAVLFSTWRFPLDAWAVTIVRRLLPNAILGLVAHEPRPLQEQTDDGFYKDDRVLMGALRRAWAALDVAFALGEQTRTVIEETWRPRASLAVIPHGDESVFVRTPPASAAATGAQVLFFGTVTAYKGIEVLLDAFGSVRARIPEARLVVRGAVGQDVPEAVVERLERAPGVDFEPGYVPAPQVQPTLEAARVVALPYLRASQSGVAHLAGTFRRPVVAAAVGDIPQAVRDGVDGWLVPSGDAAALADALVAALTDAGDAAGRGDALHQRVTADATWDEAAARVQETLKLAAR
ncbi:MAG: glycosyltransferase family 4 protein [Propionibacteriaceae bacterium]|nr:glycosyltransferase family 4 protein [Propionibacteriaceae bacterium]